MADAESAWNRDALWSLLLAIGAIAANVTVVARLPLRSAMPWLSLFLSIMALIVLARGLWRVIGRPQVYRGKAMSIALGLITVAMSASMIFLFLVAHRLPSATDSPQIGQRVPDFSLPDTSGQAVSLNSLFTAAWGDPPSVPPKAVLLIFYRGYW